MAAHRCCAASELLVLLTSQPGPPQAAFPTAVFDPYTMEFSIAPVPCWYMPGVVGATEHGEGDAVLVTHCPWCGVYLPT
jgi:hypothetical protein